MKSPCGEWAIQVCIVLHCQNIWMSVFSICIEMCFLRGRKKNLRRSQMCVPVYLFAPFGLAFWFFFFQKIAASGQVILTFVDADIISLFEMKPN